MDHHPPLALVIHEPIVRDPDERLRVARKALSTGPRINMQIDSVKAVGRK